MPSQILNYSSLARGLVQSRRGTQKDYSLFHRVGESCLLSLLLFLFNQAAEAEATIWKPTLEAGWGKAQSLAFLILRTAVQ